MAGSSEAGAAKDFFVSYTGADTAWRSGSPGGAAVVERARAITEATFGPDHPSVALSLGNLALVLWDLGDAAGARPLLERALAIDEATLGPDHPRTRIVRGNLDRL